ncbi:hypothetical protein DRO69_10915 [Candidatus Bathyarchaeota archaeon]|nr:MAG: hypothetical protein DRO69_10915 [Candidatus Bathyarchaeota archaeon]
MQNEKWRRFQYALLEKRTKQLIYFFGFLITILLYVVWYILINLFPPERFEIFPYIFIAWLVCFLLLLILARPRFRVEW